MSWAKTEIGKRIILLIKEVFKKAGRDSTRTTGNGFSEYLSSTIEETFNKRITKETFNRYYNQHISNITPKRTKPYDSTLDILSMYLDYKDFKDFVEKNETEIGKIKRECEEEKKRSRRKLMISLTYGFLTTLTLIFFISKYYKKNCMIWVDGHYEKIRCSGLDTERRLDEVVLENLRKVAVCDTTTFFKNGEPIIHYLKYKNQIEFFTYHGEHPIYEGKFLDPITETIINGHVKPCDSIIRQ